MLYYLLGVHKIRFTTDYFYLIFNFALAISINCGLGLIPSQVTIFISSMSWYRGSIIIDAEGHLRVDYPISFDQLLSKIHQFEEDHVKVVSKIDLKTNKLVEGELELLLKRYKILLRQEDYAVTFAVVANKIYGSGCSKVCIIPPSLKMIISYLSPVVIMMRLVMTLKEKYCINLDKFSTITLLLLDFCLKLAIISYLYWYSWKFLIYLKITLLFWRIIPDLNTEYQSDDIEFDINVCSDDESIIGRILNDKSTSELE